MKRSILRRVRFNPYHKGAGPSFTLILWETGRLSNRGSAMVGYQLNMHPVSGTGPCECLFEGEDYGPSPMHCIDSNAAVEGLMGFLTARPGDTDSDYFANYKRHQLDFCRDHAEALGCEVQRRFCDEEGRVLEGKR